MVFISEDIIEAEEERLLSYLNRNKNVFAWSNLDLVRVSRTIIEHSLSTDHTIWPKKQKLRKNSDVRTEAAKVEVHRQLEAKFIEPIDYPTWLANVVMVQKKNVHRLYQSQQSLPERQLSPTKDRQDCRLSGRMWSDVSAWLFLGLPSNLYEGRRQGKTSFITPFGTYCFLRMPKG
jgi:hypothetical protein